MTHDYSLIMAVMNAEKYIGQTLESVFSQSFLPSQILIVDEFSTDKTVDVIRSFSPDIQILNNTRPGMSAAMNFAIPMVTNDFVAFLDSDDLWLPTKAEKQIAYLVENPAADVVCSAVVNFRKENIEDMEFAACREFAPSRLFTASTFRTGTFEKYGFLDESVGHFGWLYAWWSIANDAGINCGSIEEVLLYRRIHESNSWVRRHDEANQTLFKIARSNIKRRTTDLAVEI